MKKLIFVISLFISGSFLKAQNAFDFTRTDCFGEQRMLFKTLDEGKVIILFFSMGCSSCETGMANLLSDYKNMDTNRVKIWYFDYNPGSTCANTFAFLKGFEVNFPSFPDADDLMQPYGFGMPLIVVAAGTNHRTFYKGGYNSTSVKNAVSKATAAALPVSEMNSGSGLSIYSMASGQIQLVNSGNKAISVSVFDIQGRMLNQNLSIHALSSSPYILLGQTGNIYFFQWTDGTKSGVVRYINP